MSRIAEVVARSLAGVSSSERHRDLLLTLYGLGERRGEHLKLLLYGEGSAISEHCDSPALFTLAVQEEAGGLLVKDRSDNYHAVPPRHDALFVVIGNDLIWPFRAAPHKVAPVAAPRVSLQFHVYLAQGTGAGV
jgi:isopenicillin N synthase-like dioxygenase